ncbi:MAG: DUF2480 family protein [Candidatus Neomarinimicrobiota bacterium]|jgi:hypothetical protein|tara:strand:+ start:404 stop:649 length:246 start_codon:yes stop_codon:yes gene_type:complete
MENISLDDFLTDGIIKEKDFRETVSLTDWSQFENKRVIIKGCSEATIPTWAYLIITANLSKYAKRIYFGEPCSAIDIYKKS